MTLESKALDLGLTPLPHLRGARNHAVPRDRRRDLVKAATSLRELLLDGMPVPCYQSHDLRRLPYPTRYGLRDACTAPLPYLQMVNRLFVVQFRQHGRLRTLLASPTDILGAARTPFFARLSRSMGPLQGILEPVLAPISATVDQVLARLGLDPAQVDYLTYDHLHTQDLRKWLGPQGLFPNARLLVMRQEWASATGLLPPQLDWYCPDGIEGVDRVVLLDGDTLLGDGVALVHTPGHTEGNHSIVVHTPEGLLVTSENGVAPDNYAPEHSRIPGLQAYARDTGMDVVLNGNTLEGAIDQYLSMIVEKTLAGPSVRDGDFPNIVASSELDSGWFAPGIRPTLAFGELSFGQLQLDGITR
jgi:hypothetical protein